MGTLAVVAEAFPLWPYWPKDGASIDNETRVLLAVTLNSGIVAADETDLADTFTRLGADATARSRALMPWHWVIGGIRLCALRTDGTDARVFKGELIGRLPDDVRLADGKPHGLEALKERLEAYLSGITRAWTQLAPVRLRAEELSVPTEAGATLQGLLASVATWPAPLAHMVDAPAVQGINLALLVRAHWSDIPLKTDDAGQLVLDANGVPVPDDDYVIVAAPIFDTFEPEMVPVSGAPEGIPAFKWTYTHSGAGVPRVAYCGGADLAKPDAAKVQYDPATYFVGKGKQNIAETLGGNPVADLPLRIAEKFDLGALIVDHMHRRVREAKDGVITPEEWEIARQAVIAVGRDMAGIGFQPPNEQPDDIRDSLLDRLLAELLTQQSLSTDGDNAKAFMLLLREWQRGLTAPNWEGLVFATVAGLASAADLRAVGSNPSEPESVLSQARLDAISRIDAALRENDALRNLLPAQMRQAIAWAWTPLPNDTGPEETLAWNAAQASRAGARSFWEKAEHALVKDILPTYNLTQALTLDGIRHLLPKILPGRDQLFVDSVPQSFPDTLKKNFAAAFAGYADLRLEGKDCAGRRPYAPKIEDTRPAPYAQRIAEQLVPDMDAPSSAEPDRASRTLYGPASPTPRPHALTVSVAPLHAAGDPASSEDNVSTDIAGYGVLIRRTTRTKTAQESDWEPWRLPIMAAVRFEGAKPSDDPVYLARHSDGKRVETAVPVSLGYGALRDGFLTYDEASFAAHDVESPRSGAASSEGDNIPVVDFILPGQELTKKTGGELPPLFAPDGLGKGWRHLPELAFGASYRLAPFVFGQACVLPPSLARQPNIAAADAAPHVLAVHKEVAPPIVPAESIRETRYLRRVPVGPMRIDPVEADLKQAQDAGKQVVTIAGVLPASGKLVHKDSDGGRFFAEGEGGLLDIGKASRCSLRFGGLHTSATDVAVIEADWEWGAGAAPAVSATRDDENLKVEIGASGLEFRGLLPAGRETWIWLNLEIEAVDGRWSVSVQCGALGVAAQAQTILVDMPQASRPAWLRVKSLSGDLLFHPAAIVDGFAPIGSARIESAVLLTSNSKSDGANTFALPRAFRIGIRPPAVGDDTFARWLRLDQFLGTKNSAGEPVDWDKVIRYASSALSLLQAKSGNRPEPKAVLEDPAVTHIVAELIPVRGLQSGVGEDLQKASERMLGVIPLALPPRPPEPPQPSKGDDKNTLIGHLARLAQTPTEAAVKCSVVDNPLGPRMAIAGSTFALQVAAGEVWDLRLYPAADPAYFDARSDGDDAARFHPGLGGPRTIVNALDAKGNEVSLVVFSPLEYRIEAARRELLAVPWNEEGGDAFWLSLLPRVDAELISVDLVRPRASSFAPTVWQAWDNVGKADLGYQAFVWSGRPLDPYPFAKSNGAIDSFPVDASSARDNVMLWEAPAFENQEGRAPLLETRAVAPGAEGVTLFETDLTAERNGAGAQHYRFRLDVHHRYSALVNQDNAAAVRELSYAASHAGPGPKKMQERWKRLFVPARPRGGLPPPAVTFAVPLTESAPGAKVPGLIAYLDEPWAVVGGLSEILDVQIAPAFESADNGPPHVPARRHVDKDRQWPEYGPDPIIRSDGFPGRDVFVPVAVSDLIGQTFDTGTATPGIHGASALIPPPALPDDFDPAWNLARLRFRRMLHPLAVAGVPVVLDDLKTTIDRDLTLVIDGLGKFKMGNRLSLTLEDGTALIDAAVEESAAGRLRLVRRSGAARMSAIDIPGPEAERCNLYVCLKRAGLRSGSHADKQGFEISIYADDRNGVMRPAGYGMFPAEFGAGLVVEATGAVVEVARTALHVSEWTPAYWSQYLGAITDAADSKNAKSIDDLSVEVADSKGDDRYKLRIKAGNASLRLKRRWDDDIPTTWEPYSGLYYRVLVTRSVYDASGTLGGEAVIGLYEADEADDTRLRMIWPAVPVDLSAVKGLRARIMLWQEAPAALAKEPAPGTGTPWDMIFPAAEAVRGQHEARREARARILQISPPIA